MIIQLKLQSGLGIPPITHASCFKEQNIHKHMYSVLNSLIKIISNNKFNFRNILKGILYFNETNPINIVSIIILKLNDIY